MGKEAEKEGLRHHIALLSLFLSALLVIQEPPGADSVSAIHLLLPSFH